MGAFKVIIVGSGLAGSLLASGLLRENIDVTVYERLERGSKREGYQLRLGADALMGFSACLEQDHIQTVVAKFGRANGSRSAAPIIYDDRFNVILDATKFPTYNKSAPINRAILRDALAEPVDRAGKLIYGKQYQEYSILNPKTASERVRVHFADGSTDDCDILIGADGSHSQVNRQLGLNNIEQITSHISLISKCELPTSRYERLSAPLRDYPVMIFSNNMSLYYCAYLPDKEGQKNMKKRNEFDEELSSCMFGMQVPVDQCPANLHELPQQEQWDLLRAVMRPWAPQFHEIVDLLEGSSIHVLRPRASKRPSKAWRSNARARGGVEQGHPRVWLVGDSMHAMLPNRGMGGNTALRDTAVALPMIKSLALYAKESGEAPPLYLVAEKLKTYEAEMMPRAFGWVEKSGGTTMMPVDSSRWTGRLFFFLAAQAMNIAYLYYRFAALFTNRNPVDDAPELAT